MKLGSEVSEFVEFELLSESSVESEKNESESHLKVQALQYQVSSVLDNRLYSSWETRVHLAWHHELQPSYCKARWLFLHGLSQ